MGIAGQDRFLTLIAAMGKNKKFQKTPKLPQAQSAEEIAARDALEDAKQKARAGRRVDCDDDKKKKKKAGADDSSSEEDSDSDDDMFEKQESESEEEEPEPEKKKGPQNMMAAFGVDLDGVENANSAAKKENKAVSAKGMKAAPAPAQELTRKEKEAMEAARKAEIYKKKHLAGETDEAKSDLARLAEVKERRRLAAEKKKAEADAESEAVAAAEEAKKAAAKAPVKVELPMPTQKEVKSALLKMQDCASDDFQTKHKLKGASGNKLAKMKYGEFQKVWQDFVDNESAKVHKEYAA